MPYYITSFDVIICYVLVDDARSEITKLQCDLSPSESKTFICSVRWNLTLSTYRHERACTLTKQAHIYKVFWSFWSCYMTFLSRWNFPFCHEITDVFLLFLHSWRIKAEKFILETVVEKTVSLFIQLLLRSLLSIIFYCSNLKLQKNY